MRGTASLAVLAVLVAGPAFADTVIGGDPPVPVKVPVNPPQLPSTPVPLPVTPPSAPAPDPTPVVNAAQQAAATASQQASDAVNQVVTAATDASRIQGPGTGSKTSAPAAAPKAGAAPRLTAHAPQPVSSHRQPASRHTLRSHHGSSSAPIVTTATVHRVHMRRHHAAPRHHVVVRRHFRPAVPALPVLAPLPPQHVGSHAGASSHHGGIHHSLAMPLPLSNRGMLIGLGVLGALALLGLRFFVVDVLPGVRAGIAARRHSW